MTVRDMRRVCHPALYSVLIIAALWIAPWQGLAAQGIPYQPPTPGDTVRLLVGPPSVRHEGALVSVTSESLVVHFRGDDTATVVPWKRVYRLDVSRGRAPRRSNLGLGAVVGALLGFTVLYFSDPDGDVVPLISRYVGGGAAVGMGTALLFPGRIRWREAFHPGATPPAEVIAAAELRPSRGGGISIQWSAIPMETGVDSDIGSGPAIRASAHGLLARLPYIEAFYTRAEGDANSVLPRIQLLGLLAGRVAQPRESGRVSLLMSGGLGRLVVNARERPPCEDPICIPVPGVEYPDARLWTAVGNLGLLVAATRRFAGRADVRVHLPVSEKGDAAHSGRTRAELSVGIAARL